MISRREEVSNSSGHKINRIGGTRESDEAAS